MNRRSLILIAIIIFAAFIRVYKINRIPSGFYSDESLVGYEAYSILKTGRDQYGNFLPVTFKAFGDYRPGLFIYSTVPFVALFGLNEFAVRLPSVIFSVLTIPAIYLVGTYIFKNHKVGLFACFLFALSPWSIQFARMSHDTNLSTCIITWAIWFYISGIQKGKNKFIIGSLILFGISLYVYYTTRVFVPLFLVSTTFILKKNALRQKKTITIGILLMLLVLVPLTKVLTNRETGWSRIDAVSLWGDPGIKADIVQSVEEDEFLNQSHPRLYHNKGVEGARAFLKALFAHFNPDFLLFYGDPVKIYQTVGNGILLLIEPFLIIIAICRLWETKNQYNSVLLLWTILGILPDTLTRLYPGAARIHLVLPVVSLVGGYGFYTLLSLIQKKNILIRNVGVCFIVLILFFNVAYFFHQNFINTPVRYAKEWHYGLNELVSHVSQIDGSYDQVWVSKRAWGWINFAFYLKYPPEKMQNEIVLSNRNEYGLGWVYDFGKYHFDDIQKNFDFNKNILYVGDAEDFPPKIDSQYTVYYPNKKVAFYIADTAHIKQACPKCDINFIKSEKK